MNPLTSLAISASLFVGLHFLLSHPLRAAFVPRLGTAGFQLLYSVVAIATFLLMVRDFGKVPDAAPWWVAGDALWALATLLMLAGSILFMGSLIGNPALPAPNAKDAAARPARGVFAITRHPMMWGFALWALVHAAVDAQPKTLILCAAMGFLALAGSAGQDRKKAVVMGDAWRGWAARTAFVPFSGQLSGRIPWADARLRPHDLAGGFAIWMAASWAHGWLGYMPAGIWRWL
jgi:uncharacterized membrane protein